jgi:hypothetical protein
MLVVSFARINLERRQADCNILLLILCPLG